MRRFSSHSPPLAGVFILSGQCPVIEPQNPVMEHQSSVIEQRSATPPLVAMVTATYNRCGDIVSLLSQIASLNYPLDRICVIVVDNGSTDDTVRRVRSEFPAVHVVENSRNLGTAVGFNVGLKQALNSQPRPKYVWLLDSDVLLEPATLAPLIDAMEQDSRIGIVGSAVYDPRQRDRLVAAGLRIEGNSDKISFVIPTPAETQDLIDVDLIAACSLLVRSETCLEVGLWDEQLKLYWGDTDWCARFVNVGYRVMCQRESRVWHRDWTDVDRGFFTPVYLHDHVRGALLFAVRHASRGSLTSARRLILKCFLRAALEQLTMRLAFARGYEWAIKDFLAASFTQRDFETIVGYPVLPNVSTVAEEIGRCFPHSQHLTITGTCDSQIKTELRDILDKKFANVIWSDQAPLRGKSPSSGEWIGQLFQLGLGILKLPFRKDLLVTGLSRPRLTNLVAARYTVFLDSQGRGLVYRNRVLAGLWQLFATLIRGFWTAYVVLPRAVRNSPPLQEAIHAVDLPPHSQLTESAAAAPESDQVYVAR